MGDLVSVGMGTPVVENFRPCASRGVSATYVRYVGDCGELQDVRCAVVNDRCFACRAICFVVVFAVVRAGSPLRAANFLHVVVHRCTAARHAVQCMGRFVVSHDRGNVRCLCFSCYAQRILALGPIACLVKFGRWGRRSPYGILGVAKWYRAGDRANENRWHYGQNHFRARYAGS